MTISDFTVPEINFFRDNCNFVNFEKAIFEGRVSGKTLSEIAEEEDISYEYARKISRKVNKKILRVL